MYVYMLVSGRSRPPRKVWTMNNVLTVAMVSGFIWFGLVLSSFVFAIVARDMGADFETVMEISRFFTFN